MKKSEFLNSLRKKLSPLPKSEIQEHVSFYSEMIDDRIEEGLTEDAAVDAAGSISDIAASILSESGADERTAKKRKSGTWETVLLIIGSPIWGTIFVTCLAIAWSLVLTLWAVEIPFLVFSYLSKYLIKICTVTSIYLGKFSKEVFRNMASLFNKDENGL